MEGEGDGVRERRAGWGDRVLPQVVHEWSKLRGGVGRCCCCYCCYSNCCLGWLVLTGLVLNSKTW